MRETIYGVIVTTVVMLVTSGVLALAFAAPREETRDAEAEAYVAEMLEAHYAEVLAENGRRR